MQHLVVYDNTLKPNEIIRDIIGEKGFGDVIVKRKQLIEIYFENIQTIFEIWQWNVINSSYDVELLVKKLENMDKEKTKILHCFSNHIITNKEKAGLTYKKLSYICEPALVQAGETYAAVMFQNMETYIDFLGKIKEKQDIDKVIKECRFLKLSAEGMGYIGNISNFIQCIAGNFDSRYFNSLQGTEYRLRKSSVNKKKIRSEYEYFRLLPEHMKSWFVMPFDYLEDENSASYAMERLHMADIAIKWVHGSIQEQEFTELMDMYFYFFQERSRKSVDQEVYWSINHSLYVTKVSERIEQLEKIPEFQIISNLLSNNERLRSINAIYDKYIQLKEQIEKKVNFQMLNVIGHGDPCFANAMYNRSTRTLKFIDPKGALTEEELWTDPYYDIAKLSHSVCGLYDFFNNAMFDIAIDDKFDYMLKIPFDNRFYKAIFRRKAEENGFDYWTVRLYEASLFLSMLPLHMDYPHKVFGFILNAANILEEIENHVQ